MIRVFANLKAAVAALLFTGLFAGALASGAPSEQAREDRLLRDLAGAPPGAAPALARELETLWDHSGSAAMDLLLRRGREAAQAGDFEAAIDHLSALVDHAPGFAQGWSQRARAYFAVGRYGPAVADLERALALNPRDYNAIFGLGQVFEFFGDDVRAHEAYLRAKAIHPNHEEVTKALDRLSATVEGKAL